MAAHLPGMCGDFPNAGYRYSHAHHVLGGRDSCIPIVQMPSEFRLQIQDQRRANAGNSGGQDFSNSDQELLQKLKDYKEELKNQVVAKRRKTAGSWIKNINTETNLGG